MTAEVTSSVIDLDAIEARAERRAQLRRYTIVSCRPGFACEPGGGMVEVERDRTVTEYASETPPADADLALVIADARAHRARADAAEADRDYWREQATGMAPSVDGMRALGTRLFPGGTGCVVDPERVVAEVERLRERVADAEAEASRWGDALVAIGEAIGMPGCGSAEIVEGVRNMVSSAQRNA